MWDVHGARISNPDLKQMMREGFRQLAPGSRVAWGVVNMTLPRDDGVWGVDWGWKWLTVAEAATNDALSPPP